VDTATLVDILIIKAKTQCKALELRFCHAVQTVIDSVSGQRMKLNGPGLIQNFKQPK
jgi:hypothetical protein